MRRVLAAVAAVLASCAPPAAYAVFSPQPSPVVMPGGYGVLLVVNGVPARWNPCTPVIKIHMSGATKKSRWGRELQKAVTSVRRISGLPFEIRSNTSFVPQYHVYNDPSKSGPELTVWIGNRGATNIFTNRPDNAYAIADFWADDRLTGADPITHAAIVVDRHLASGLDDRHLRGVFKHELGHALNLDHVDDFDSLMQPTLGNQTWWGPGDITGLRAVGASRGCVP